MDRRPDDDEGSSGASDSFRMLIEESVDGVLVVDTAGYVQFANRASSTLLKKLPEALVGFQLGYPAISKEPVELVIPAHRGKASVLELRAAKIRWQGRDSLLINLRDMTERQQQAVRITQLNADLRTLLQIHEVIVRATSARALLQAACDIMVQREDCRTASIGLHEENEDIDWTCSAKRERDDAGVAATPELEQDFAPIVTSIESDGRTYGDMTLNICDGRSHYPEQTDLVKRVSADLGQALRHLDVATALRESETRFRRLFENSIDAIMIADGQGRYVHINSAACAMTGYSRDQLLAMHVADLIVPTEVPAAAKPDESQVLRSDERGTFVVRCSDGETSIVDLSAFKLTENRFVSVLRDVTRHRLLEEQLRQSQKMEAVGKLAGGIAHDFNNLLTGIISFAGFVEEAMPDGDQRRDDIAEVLRAAHRAADLTRQLLTVSRRQPISPETTNLNALVASLQRLLHRTLGEDIEIIFLAGDDVPEVFVDPGQFEQVVLNLAVNARDAMPAGGTLTIETRRGDPLDDASDSCAILRVLDTGTGIHEDVKASIFEPFFTTKAVGRGTGLGLSLVYGLVSQAHGHIAVHSEPGQGACFEIRLPPSKQERIRHRDSPAVPMVDRVGTETILVVEDEALVRRAALRMLSKSGYRVLAASNGIEAIALVGRTDARIDLLLCDVVMPQMNGLETADALRSRQPDLKVLFMTGYTDNVLVHHGVLDSDIEILPKPFTEQVLVTRIRQLLDGAASRPSTS